MIALRLADWIRVLVLVGEAIDFLFYLCQILVERVQVAIYALIGSRGFQ